MRLKIAQIALVLLLTSIASAQTTVSGIGTPVNGNSVSLPAGWTASGSGSSQQVTAPGTIAANNVVAGTTASFKTPVDVTHPKFGPASSCANVADPTGTNDSTCAINAAVAYQQSPAIAGAEPVLHIPAGTYKVSDELRIPCTMHVKGDGPNATVLKLTNNSAFAGVVITGYGASATQPDNLWTCNGSIEDLAIYAPGGHLFTGTLLENYNAGYRVRNVRLSNGGGRGLNLVGNAERMSVENLTVDTTRWPLVSFGNENHFWKTNIAAPGTTDAGYYCYGANCVNGVGPNRQWSGNMTLESATGDGSTATYVVSCAPAASCPGAVAGQSPIVAGHWFTIAGVIDTTGLNGMFQAVSVTNHTPTGKFTITAANTSSGTGTVTSATFQPTILPETHAAAWLSGTDVEFNGGSIKALWNSDCINVTGGQAITVQNVYCEGYPINGSPTLGANVVVNGLQDTTTLTATLTGTSCSGGSPCIASVADTSWSPVFVSAPQDIGQIDYYTMRIAPADFDPTQTGASAYVAGVNRNQFETVLGGFTSGNKFYITSRNYTGSTAPSNTAWPSGSYVLDDRTATFANQVTTINNHFNALNGPGNTNWNVYCVDSEAVGANAGSTTAHSCASVKVGTQPDGKMEFAPNSGNVNTTWNNAAMYATINDSFFSPKTETLGGNWIKAYTTGAQTDYVYIETNAAPQLQSGETTEVQTGQIQLGSSIPVQAIQNATGVASNVYVRNLTSGTSSINNSQLGISWFGNNITNPSFNDANLGSNPGYSGYAFGSQYTTSHCWYDTAASHALNRFCLKGSPDLTGTNAGFEYDTWSGTAWVKQFGVNGSGTISPQIPFSSIGANAPASAAIASATFVAPATVVTTDNWYNTSNSTAYAQSWNQFVDTSNKDATTTPTAINRQWYCTITNGGTCLPFHDTWNPAATSTLTINNMSVKVNGNPLQFKSFEGTSGAPTYTAGAAIPSATVAPACTSGHPCDTIGGTISFTTGSSTTTGTLLTFPLANGQYPNCTVQLYTQASPFTQIPVRATNNYTTETFTVGTAPATSTAYELVYVCHGT